MNKSFVISLPLAPGAVIPAYARVKFSQEGIEIADENDRSIGHCEQDCNYSVRPVIDVYRSNSGGLHFATASEPLVAGEGFVGADDGMIQAADEHPEGIVIQDAEEGATIMVAYYSASGLTVTDDSGSEPEAP
jgi:hypothetical protein